MIATMDDSRSDEEEEKNTPKALVCCDIFRCNKFVHERCYIKACNIVDGEYYNAPTVMEHIKDGRIWVGWKHS